MQTLSGPFLGIIQWNGMKTAFVGLTDGRNSGHLQDRTLISMIARLQKKRVNSIATQLPGGNALPNVADVKKGSRARNRSAPYWSTKRSSDFEVHCRKTDPRSRSSSRKLCTAWAFFQCVGAVRRAALTKKIGGLILGCLEADPCN